MEFLFTCQGEPMHFSCGIQKHGPNIKMMIIFLYKTILRRLKLSRPELLQLKELLTEEHICCGPFISGSKMCPTTTALNLRLGPAATKDSKTITNHLKRLGIGSWLLIPFYLTFDLPSMISRKIFLKKLEQLRDVVEELTIH